MLRYILLLLAASTGALAQTSGSATLVGTVTDSTGGRVVDAKVTVVNTNTSFTSTTVTRNDGEYYVPYLSPGPYRLTIEAAGFKQYVRDGIVLRTNETPRLDVQLEVGNVAESITITAAPPLLETETSGSGQILEGNTIVRIPLLAKYLPAILFYYPGASGTANNMHVVGQRQRSIGYTMDGVSAKEPGRFSIGTTNRVASTTTDALQEAKLWTTGLPAEFGHSAGGLLSTVFKSGTNQIHGSAEDRYINENLIHRQYFDQVKPNPISYHELSATLGGPVYLPKVYNGKDKTFFFFGSQRHHEKSSAVFIGDVPSPDMLNGDFSFGGIGNPLYDPLTTRQDAAGKWGRDPFEQNHVPASRFDSVARNFLGHNPFTAPNSAGFTDRTGPHQNLVVPNKYRSYRTRWDAKLDHQFNPAHKMFGRYSQVRNRAFNGNTNAAVHWALIDPNIVPIPIDQRNVVVSDSYIFNPTTVNEARLGYNRRRFTRAPDSMGQDWAKQLGIPNVGPATFPSFLNSSGAQFYNNAPGGKSQEVAEDFSFQENFTKILGGHTIKTGYEVIRSRFNALQEALPSGQYRMGGTDFPFTPNTGNDFAAFLLGTVVRADFTQAMATWLPRWWAHALYVQDDFKPRRNVTINMGLRWSYESPFNTKYGQQSQFHPTATDPITGKLGAILHPKAPLAKRDLNNFQPRLGLAWNFRPAFVFRGSFGLTTVDLFTNGINQNFDEYFATAVVQPPTGDPRIAFRLSQGPPSIQLNAAPDGSIPFVGTNFSGRNASWFDPNMRMPYIMNWSGGFQWEFASRWLMELLYQGSSGVGLLNNWDINAIPLNISTDRAQLDRIYQSTQNYKPYPQFGSIQHYSNYGHSTYHGGTLRFEKRYSTGMTLNAFYTFSKALDEADDDGTASGITFYNRRLEKGRAGYDLNHNFSGIFTYELPFGKTRRFMKGGGLKDVFLGGWNLAWIQAFQSGTPVNMTFAGSPNRYLPGSSRPNQVLPNDQAKVQDWSIGPNRFPITAQNRYLNIDAFGYPDPYQPGMLGRNTISAPGLSWAQGSLSKEFPILERAKFILRWDINNPYKAPNFSAPNAAYNATNPANFGRFTGTRGGFTDIGCRLNSVIVLRLEW